MTHEPEVCVRCGHQTPDCPTCDRSWPFLGSSINGEPYCHTFVDFDDVMGDGVGSTCYELSSRELSFAALVRQPEGSPVWLRRREIRDVHDDGSEFLQLLIGLENIRRAFPEVTE